MKFCSLFLLIISSYSSLAQLMTDIEFDYESSRINMIADIIKLNFKKNGWSTIFCVGNLPDEFYIKLRNISHSIAISNIDSEEEDIGDVVRYYSNTIIISLQNITEYDDIIAKVKSSPYWHPLANVILYYHQNDKDILAKLFFSFWFHKAINAIIIQYDDTKEVLLISQYTPFTVGDDNLENQYGCWTSKKIGLSVPGFDEGLTCVEKCHNVTINSKLKANYLGTCVSFSTIIVPYNASNILGTMELFKDKAQNFHGFPFRAFATESGPFFNADDNGNGSYTLRARDGMIWNAMAKLMNFSIDLSPSKHALKAPFNFEVSIRQIFDFTHRKADLFLSPIYLFDLIIVEVDYSFPFKESGVCIMSYRAGFKTTLFDAKSLYANRSWIAQFFVCFLSIWLTFSIYQRAERDRLTFDQIGKDLLNTFRNVLLITLCNPPRKKIFRIFLTVSIWSFFILNFATQGTIISFLTAAKRGNNVETFDDMIEKGYLIYGMASPDLILPDTEERFRIINSRLVPVPDLFGCVKNMSDDPYRFCLIDCAVGRYFERNRLSEGGEQFLHIAKDRMHSHYLTIIFIKHSPLTERFDKYLMTFYEAGLIKKWEQYRYTDIKEEAPVKALGINDFKGLFNIYLNCLGFISVIFILELIIFHVKRITKNYMNRRSRRLIV